MLHLQLHRRRPPRTLLGGGVAGHGDQRDSLVAVVPLTQQDVPIGGGISRRRRKAIAQMADPAIAEEVGVAQIVSVACGAFFSPRRLESLWT